MFVGVRQLHELLADLFVGAAHEELFVALHAAQGRVQGVGEGRPQHRPVRGTLLRRQRLKDGGREHYGQSDQRMKGTYHAPS